MLQTPGTGHCANTHLALKGLIRQAKTMCQLSRNLFVKQRVFVLPDKDFLENPLIIQFCLIKKDILAPPPEAEVYQD